MMGRQLGLDLASGFQQNANYDDDGVAAERQSTEVTAGDDISDHRNHSDCTEEDRTDQSDAVQDLGDVISRRLAGTDTGDEAAVLLQVVGNLNRVEGNRGVYESVGFREYGRNPKGFRSRLSGWQELVLMRLELDRRPPRRT